MKKFVERLLCIVCLVIMLVSSVAPAYAAGRSRFISVKSIELNYSKITLNVSESTKLTVTYKPSNCNTGKSVTWSSSNKSVATVSDGTVKAVAEGTATITAKSKNGKTATCKVTVKRVTEGINLKVYMTHSMKQGDYKEFVVNGSNVGCSAVAQAIASSVLAKADVDPRSCWDSKKNCAIPNKYYSYTEKSWNAEAVYKELKNGRPVLVHYRYKKSGQHYVAVIGVSKGVEIKNLTYSDFICIDPYTGKTVRLNKATKFYDSSVKYINTETLNLT